MKIEELIWELMAQDPEMEVESFNPSDEEWQEPDIEVVDLRGKKRVRL